MHWKQRQSDQPRARRARPRRLTRSSNTSAVAGAGQRIWADDLAFTEP
jgi:hypothetical protein